MEFTSFQFDKKTMYYIGISLSLIIGVWYKKRYTRNTLEYIIQNQINTAITDLNKIENKDLKTFIANFNDESGFIWCLDPKMKQVRSLISQDIHSGASYACMLRTIQTKLRQ